jgi:hypothetical protein
VNCATPKQPKQNERTTENFMHRARQRRQNRKLIRASAWVPGLLVALALSALSAIAVPASAQETASTVTAALPTSAATSAAGPALSADATSTPPKTPAAQVGKLPLDGQVRWLSHAALSGMLANMSDPALVSLFKSLDPLALPRYLKNGPNGYPSYEFTMLRRERIHGKWPDQADHMLVRVTRDPLRVYAKWLPDGAHAGQEILYDETARPNEMYGHLGGLLKVIALWTSLNGTLARSQSRHSVRDLGTEYITQQFLAEGKKFADAGSHARQRHRSENNGRCPRGSPSLTKPPSGQPEFYAKKEILGLDLRRPYFRTAESFDNDGKIFESIVFQNIAPKTFEDATFSPKNPAYNF